MKRQEKETETVQDRGPLGDILQVEHISKYYRANNGKLFDKTRFGAVRDVTFQVRRGETFGLVGESGCGKSTLAKLIMNLIKASGGTVRFDGKDIYRMAKKELDGLRREMQIVFQDPYDSLNPRFTLKQIVAEPMENYGYGKAEIDGRVRELFAEVGLPEKLMGRYPHQLSGGQRQRLCIARSLALSPKLLLCDEVVSALDVSIQAQILNLLLDLKEKNGLTYVFISHNLAVVKFVSDRIGVMYFGNLVEVAEKNELFANCLHPYSCALLSAVPVPDPDVKMRRLILKGELPNLMNPPKGCIFQDRCPFVKERCRREAPALSEYEPGHFVACHRAGELDLTIVQEPGSREEANG